MGLGICYIAPDVHIPHFRGASTHVLELSMALKRLGDNVHVVCRRSPYEKSDEIFSGINLHRLYRGVVGPLTRKESLPSDGFNQMGITSLGYSAYLRSFFTLYAGLKASYVAKVNESDLIIERETAFGAGAFASRMIKKPLVLELIGPNYSKVSMEESKIILAYNERMVPEYARRKTIYVKAAVNTNLFRPDTKARQAIRRKYGVDDSTIVVGYVGTFQSWHGLDDLVGAANYFLNRSDIKFLLVGPMPQNKLELLRIDNIIVAGPVPYNEVYQYINAFDIAVAPYNLQKSTLERKRKGMGSPLKILEYMACAKPCVSSSVRQVTDILEDNVSGKIFPEGDIKSLIIKIEELADSETDRRIMGYNAFKAAQNYTWDRLAEQIHEAVESYLQIQS